MFQETGHIKNTVIMIFWEIQCLHLMNFEVAQILVFSRTQVQPQTILIQNTFQTIFPFLMTKMVCNITTHAS